MRINLTPIAAAMALLLATQAYAQGGAAGENGLGSVIGKTGVDPNDDRGTPGTTGANANGKDGKSYTEETTIGDGDFDPPPVTPSSGLAGKSPANATGGGGAGGHGGGSVIGATSTGGAGGSSTSSSANGGNGGNVSNITIEFDSKTLDASGATSVDPDGATGSAGGSVTSTSSTYGGGGSAGHGGDRCLAVSPPAALAVTPPPPPPPRTVATEGRSVATPSTLQRAPH